MDVIRQSISFGVYNVSPQARNELFEEAVTKPIMFQTCLIAYKLSDIKGDAKRLISALSEKKSFINKQITKREVINFVHYQEHNSLFSHNYLFFREPDNKSTPLNKNIVK